MGPLKDTLTSKTAGERAEGAAQLSKAVSMAGPFDAGVGSILTKMHDVIADDDKAFARAREGVCLGTANIARSLGEDGSPLFAPMMLAVLRCCSDSEAVLEFAALSSSKRRSSNSDGSLAHA